MTLNPQQQKAVDHGDGPLLVLAGPGSGKTRVLVHRVAGLVQTRGVYPSQILAVTFTNKAAGEMLARLESMIGPHVRELTTGTFHSVCLRILRKHSETLGLAERFVVYDESDQLALVKECMGVLNVDRDRMPPQSVLNTISRAKDACEGPVEFAARVQDSTYLKIVSRIYSRYQERLGELCAVDFGDLIRLAVRFFEKNPAILESYRQRWRYILVDEYQDTNLAQYRFISQLARGHMNICVVGDDDQCLVTGTFVTMADGSRSPIERICEGDEVLSCYGRGDLRPARVTGIFKNNYKGEGIVIHLQSGRKVVSTSGHVHFAGYRLGAVPQTYFTYLMQKRGVGWRLGTSQVYTAGQCKPMVGFKQRLMHEHADALWVVGTHSSENEARAEEYILSLKYRLPTLPFVPRQGKGKNGLVHDAQYIKRIFATFDTEKSAKRLLADRGLSMKHAHHRPRSRNSVRRNVVVTLCGDRRGRSPMHLICISGNDAEGRSKIEALGFSVRPAKRDSRSWRFETGSVDFGRIDQILKALRKIFDLNEFYVARLGTSSGEQTETNSLPFLPAGSVTPGMAMFSEDGSYDIVERVEKKVLHEVVYDLNIERTHNFIVNGIITHNSVYRWRGADIANILRFEKDFPGATVVRLEQNYRSTSSILAAAQAVVAKNAGRKPKDLWTENARGSRVMVIPCETERREALVVAERINAACRGKRRYGDIAIFYRTNAQSRPFEDIFRAAGIPYRIFGGLRFYERVEIKDILAYLRLIVDPLDDISLKRIINVPARGIGKTTIERLRAFARERHLPMFEAIGPFVESIKGRGKSAQGLLKFEVMIRELSTGALQRPLEPLIRDVLERSGYVDELAADSGVVSEARLENINALVSAAAEFVPGVGQSPVACFLDQVALVTGADDVGEDKGAVTMMTLHLAKGLEFPCVYIVGMEEGLLPHTRSMDDPDELEEERRLCYVGMTRAKEELVLSHAFRRRNFGSERYGVVSRFLDDIPEQYVLRHASRVARSPSPLPLPAGRQAGVGVRGGFARNARRETRDEMDFDQRPPEERGMPFMRGMRVMHPKFGVGTVHGCEKTSAGHKVIVNFSNGQVKRLIAELAGLTIA